METKKQVTVEGKILKNPYNYAAIYARISAQKDNNSIEAQISKGKTVLKNENLLLYAVYSDKTSGRTVSPPDRPGFGKLLSDAKAGCFKTIVAYKHDRIARNLKDWINLKSQLKKMGIKIIFSDGTEYISDNSLQGEFIENLIVMVAELEPNNINERVKSGREQRRKEGVYSQGIYTPFGYEKAKSRNPSQGKSYYKIKPLEVIFIQHLYLEAKTFLVEKNFKLVRIQETMAADIDKFLEIKSIVILNDELISYAESIKTALAKHLNVEESLFLQNIIEELKKHLKGKNLSDTQRELNKIKIHFSTEGNLKTILSNPIYAKYMLRKVDDKQQGITIFNNVPKLQEQSFVELRNVARIIDRKTFSKVYCYMIMPQVIKAEEPDYLFKGKLKCGYCNVYLHYKDGLLKCTNIGIKSGCKAYLKTNVIEAVLDVILDDAFNNSSEGFNRFRKAIEDKQKYFRENLQKLRYTKMIKLKEFLIDKDKGYIKEVASKEKEINLLLHKIANYEYELDNINKLQKQIENYNKLDLKSKKSNIDFSKAKSSIITYIISNEDYFNSVFDKLIKEIKVKTIEHKKNVKCEFSIKYEFQYSKPGDLLARIDK